MGLSTDLLEQSRHLLNREVRRPRQASLRRSVSAAYYGLFHYLIAEAILKFPRHPENLRHQVARAFQHSRMRDVCKIFASNASANSSISKITSDAIDQRIKNIASVFIDLQQARNSADYDLDFHFTRKFALQKVIIAEQAIAGWKQVRDTEDAAAFLSSLLFHNLWSKS